MNWVLALAVLAAVLAVPAAARQDQAASILSPSAENDLRRTPINLNPYLRRSLLRALYHLEAEYQQQQALEAGRALSNGVPVIGEYHRTAPAVLKDPALRRALLRVLIHLEAEDLDKRAHEEAASELNAKERQALRDAQEQNNFLRNYMDENFPTDSPPAAQQQPQPQQQQQQHNPQQRDIPSNMAEYIKYANEISGSHPGSVPAAGTQVNSYAEQPAPTQDQQYNGHQLPYNQQQQQQNYNADQQQQQQQQNYNADQQQQQQQQNYNADQQQQQQQQNYNADQQQQQQQQQQQADANQQYGQQAEADAGLELQTALPSQNYDDTRLALNFQTDYTTPDPYSNHNYNATTEQPVPTTTDYYQTANPTDEYPTTAAPPSAPGSGAAATGRQVDGFFFQSPDPVQDDGTARDNSVGKDGAKGQEQRSVHNANTIPTAETPADTTALPTQDTTVEAAATTITTAKPASTTEDIKIFQAPLLAAFTLHQDAHGTPQRIVPLYRKAAATATAAPTVATKLDEEQELKQQQLLLEEQLRRLQELQAKQQQLLKLQQFLTQEQERQRQLKKAHLAKAVATIAPQQQDQQQQQQLQQQQLQQQQLQQQQLQQQQTRVTPSVADSTYITQAPTTVPAPTAQPTLVAQSSTPEAAVQIHHSQGDTERQKQIEEYDKQRTLELERARKQAILEALERERQQKIIEAENARQRQLQQFYEEQHRLRLQEQERQRLASLDLTFQRSVEFNAQQIAPPAAPAPGPGPAPVVPAPAAAAAPREPSEEQRLTYRSFQQEPPPLPANLANNVFSNNIFPPQQQAGFHPGFQPASGFGASFQQFPSFQPSQPEQPTIQPAIQVPAPSFAAVAPQQAPPLQPVNSRPNRHEPFGSTANFGFNNFEQSRNLFFNSQPLQQLQPHPQRQRGLDGQLQTLLHQSGISAPQEDLNIVSKVLALNPERPDQLVGLF